MAIRIEKSSLSPTDARDPKPVRGLEEEGCGEVLMVSLDQTEKQIAMP
ncbi:hypothetical protein BIFGAL_02931 [Bifidobacterium gallicum DSM 20093 = LMG 11596]|uniref:Uncharacterized protein n=1 Tax=Bifidobacterium gallicum DSM 20093 = LMG 11596 TaxID=561180 RepID=D1NT19_9BIFI|nr:hypothetical protein BIFGAL_02931 [Bifidobacterium gallicum DSM 20093 = LMG 11596]